MFRRDFLKTTAAAGAVPAVDQVDRLINLPRNGKMHARFFRKTEGHEAWPEVEPQDIKPGDVIMAIGVNKKGLWIVRRTVVGEFFTEPDGVWCSFDENDASVNCLKV